MLAGVAAAAAVAFAAGLGVPAERPAGPRGTIVRWGHAFTWVMLVGLFLSLGLGSPLDALTPLFGLAALAGYLTFLGTLLTSPRR